MRSRLGFVAGVVLVVLAAFGWMLGSKSDGDSSRPKATVQEDSLAIGFIPGRPTAAGPVAAQASPHASSGLSLSRDPEIESLRTELETDPARLDLRQRLTLRLLRRGQFFEAFEEAERIIEQAPDDVDGLFVLGAVRVRMGQASRALPLLDRVLERIPEHVPALTAKGQALLRAGHEKAALEIWTHALELSDGSNRQVEELLRSVSTG